jgi:SAM-dependent methyltransferase
MDPNAYLEMADTESRHWWFLGRRVLLSSVIHRLALPRNARILEIGSGTGGNLEMLSAFGRVSALEMDATARSIAHKKTLDRFDIRAGFCPTDIPFSDEKFDLICLFDVLEHIEEDFSTLVALKTLIADRGSILVTVPAYQWLWSRHDEFLHHKRRYSAQELRQKIASAGLRIDKISYFNTLLFPLAVVARLKDRLLGATSASGAAIPADPLNSLLYKIFSAERHLLDRASLPFGVSLLAVLRAE